MKRAGLIFLMILSGVSFVFSIDWPIRDVVLTATFGESRKERFHNGVEISGGEQPVYPVQEGEIIFYQEEGEYEWDIPSGLGSFVLLESKGGILSSYSHLKRGSIEKNRTILTRQDSLGVLGDSGYAFGNRLHLAIFDRELKHTVNPLFGLPGAPDKRKPVIQRAYLAKGSETLELKGIKAVPPGQYAIVAEIYDLSDHVSYFCPMAPHTVIMLVQGEEVMSVTFDALAVPENRSVLVNKGKPIALKELYQGDWEFKSPPLNLKPGKVSVEIIAKDFTGNETVEQFDILVAE